VPSTLGIGAFHSRTEGTFSVSARCYCQAAPTACLASRLQVASKPAVFCMNHILEMLLETELRPVGKLIGIGVKSQQVDVQVLDGFFVPGAIEKTYDIDPCGLGGHGNLFKSLTDSEQWRPRSGLGEEPEIATS